MTARLTEREKEALRLWLEHRTAKEIALDLGISHHAVEKRLKMARTKLGTATSLQAARLLADAESRTDGYHQTGAYRAELPQAQSQRAWSRYRPILFGGITMSLTVAFTLAFAPSGEIFTDAQASPEPAAIQLDTNVEPIFNLIDENRSGYLEQPESPFVAMALVDPPSPAPAKTTAVLGDNSDAERIASFYAEADTDGDGRVSFREFHVWHSANLAQLGITTTIPLKVSPPPDS